jgi:sulfite exporter TauE/SafE
MIWTALILGFAGSLHCLGMCSPLAMAVTNGSPAILLNRILYNFGRLLTYGLLGGLVASVGLILPMVNYQNLLSILLGAGLIAIGVSGMSAIKIPVVSKALGMFSVFLKQFFVRFLKHKSYSSTFFLGSLNGFLPCGLSFLALTYCVTLSGPLDGFYFMALFGLGTLPVMLGVTSIFMGRSLSFISNHTGSQRLC